MDASTWCGMAGVWRDADDLRLWHYAFSPTELHLIARTKDVASGAHVTRLEMLAYLVSCQVWGIPSDGAVEFVSDNRSTTLILNNARARTDAVCGGIVQTLAGLFHDARTTACATWAPGQLNGIADLASRTADPVGLLSTLTRAFPDLRVSVQSLTASPLAQIPALDATRSARLVPCRNGTPQ